MFGRKKALLERIEELELLLEQEKRKNADIEAELEDFREQEYLQERTFQELKMAMEDKIRELDERMEEFEQEKEEQSRRLEAEKKQMHRRMEEEADAARLDLDREMADEKKRTHSALMEQVRFFHESYNQYLSGIMAQMDLLSKTAVSVGSRFLTMDVPDVQGMFRSEMQEPAIEDSASDSEVRQVPVLNSSESRQTESKERIPLHGNAVGDASEEVAGSYMDEGEERVDRVLNILKKNMETDALRN